MEDDQVFNFQTWICPICFDDHGRDNIEKCRDNLKEDVQRLEKREEFLNKVIVHAKYKIKRLQNGT